MKVTNVRIKLAPRQPGSGPLADRYQLLASVSMTIDNAMELFGMKLSRRKRDDAIVLHMASEYRASHPDIWDDLYVPVSKEARAVLTAAAVAAYNRALAERGSNGPFAYDMSDGSLTPELRVTKISVAMSKYPDSHIKAFVSARLNDSIVLTSMIVTQHGDELYLRLPYFRPTRSALARAANNNSRPVRTPVYRCATPELHKQLSDAILTRVKNYMEKTSAEPADVPKEEAADVQPDETVADVEQTPVEEVPVEETAPETDIQNDEAPPVERQTEDDQDEPHVETAPINVPPSE